MSQVENERESIHLEQFLKVQGLAGTGGQAKTLIQTGKVLVNGHVEVRRKRQLFSGDQVAVFDQKMVVEFE